MSAAERRIVLPVHHFPPHYSAGAEVYTYRLAHGLQARGWEVEIVAIEAIDRGSTQRIDAERSTYEGIPVWRLSHDLINAPDRREWTFDNPLLGAWFRDYFARVRPNLAHFQAGYLIGVAPVFAARQAGVPTLLTLHDYWYICPQHTLLRGDGTLCTEVPTDPRVCVWCRRMSEPLPRLAVRLGAHVMNSWGPRLSSANDTRLMEQRRSRTAAALRSFDRVISVSEFVAEMVRANVDRLHVEVCRAGIRDERFDMKQRPASSSSLRIGYLGQLAAHKGVHYLLEAFQKLRAGPRQPVLEIYGGPLTTDYATRLVQAAAGDPRITFHGTIANGQVPDVLSALDVLVVPSVWYENSPLVVLESLAAGTPVIASDLGGLKEMVDPGRNGLRVPHRDAAQIAAALQSLIDEPERLLNLQAGARATEVRSQADEMAQLLTIYEEVLASGRLPRVTPVVLTQRTRSAQASRRLMP